MNILKIQGTILVECISKIQLLKIDFTYDRNISVVEMMADATYFQPLCDNISVYYAQLCPLWNLWKFCP